MTMKTKTDTSTYVYFVAYTHPRGTGMCEAIRTGPITDWNDILDITQAIRNKHSFDWVNLSGYQLMSGPNTCTTFGCHGTATGQEVEQ
ncbi:hypothetical protein FB566_2363 [Stackebrandtia endophytica]|uniref:Uncharacterized protein n=1 Tax=Stackebrandtia endophytica TaxID=1496996 RepID=A0A543AW64_9ACTN|nr:hypothetical protein [Stackebrandtia endophytica]TQL76823.1 hypothetical protein FB566_2363 [Stackebrandtia endophytica]